jgi:hypothetical protein
MVLDTTTDTELPNIHPYDVYNDRENIRWLLLPSVESINETLIRIQSHMKDRYVVWYGPGTSSETYFNI